jgi:hypothetical protein
VNVVVAYGEPTMPVGKEAGVATIRAAATVREKVPVVVLEVASLTFTVKVYVPVAVGVPERTPAGERLNHEGSEEPLATVQV